MSKNSLEFYLWDFFIDDKKVPLLKVGDNRFIVIGYASDGKETFSLPVIGSLEIFNKNHLDRLKRVRYEDVLPLIHYTQVRLIELLNNDFIRRESVHKSPVESNQRLGKPLTFEEAYNFAQPNQYIKALGDSFNSNSGYYFKDKKGMLHWSNGGAGTIITPNKIPDLFKSDRRIYGVYNSQTDLFSINENAFFNDLKGSNGDR